MSDININLTADDLLNNLFYVQDELAQQQTQRSRAYCQIIVDGLDVTAKQLQLEG